MIRVYRHLDWLSITLRASCIWRSFIPGLEWQLSGVGRHGYTKRYIDRRTGATLETASNDKTMGHHLTLSGEPLAELRALDLITDDSLCQRIAAWDGRVSRVDLAIDAWGCTFTPSKLSDDLQSHAAHIKARTWRLIEGHKKGIAGDTLDTGSQVSDKRFRMYDKGAEKRIKDGDAWMRLELQLRRKFARAACGSCIENGAQETVTGHISDYLRWENQEYTQILTAPSAPPGRIQRTEPKRRAWLKGQVARALASEIAMDESFRAEFDVMVNCWYERLTNPNKPSTLDK